MAAAAMIVGLGISIFGTIMQVEAANKAAAAQKKALALQQKSEAAREQAMRLDAKRRQREAIRQSIIARSQALSAGTNQGAQYGTALPGAYGQISGQLGNEVSGIAGQAVLGAEIFKNNRGVLSARKEEADAGAMSALGGGISSLGGAVGRSLGAIGRMT